MIQSIKGLLDVPIEENDISFHRLISHLRYAIERQEQDEIHTLDEEMLLMIKRKYSLSYRCAKGMSNEVEKVHGIQLPEHELGYITLHIERLRKKAKE